MKEQRKNDDVSEPAKTKYATWLDETKETKDDFFTAENLTKIISEAHLNSNPTEFEIFVYNILKAKILLISSECLSEILTTTHPKIIERVKTKKTKEEKNVLETIIEELAKVAETGSASFLAYTEQAIVTAVTSFETYFRDRLSKAIATKPELARQFSDRQIKLKDIIDVNYDVKKELGNLIINRTVNFQDIDAVVDLYYKLFSERVYTDDEIILLKQVFEVRHLIIHRAGIVDRSFLHKTGLDLVLGERLILHRMQIANVIDNIENIVERTEKNIFIKRRL